MSMSLTVGHERPRCTEDNRPVADRSRDNPAELCGTAWYDLHRASWNALTRSAGAPTERLGVLKRVTRQHLQVHVRAARPSGE